MDEQVVAGWLNSIDGKLERLDDTLGRIEELLRLRLELELKRAVGAGEVNRKREYEPGDIGVEPNRRGRE